MKAKRNAPFGSGTLVVILLLSFGSCILHPASAQDVTPAQLRQMTAEEFQTGIDKQGAAAFTARVTRDIDPHSQDEPNYDIILNHISGGQEGWLKVAAAVAPFTQDPNFNQGLSVALAYALLKNPAGVLRLRTVDNHFVNACKYPFPLPSDAFLRRFHQNALAALSRVHDPSLQSRKEECRQELQTVPAGKALDVVR